MLRGSMPFVNKKSEIFCLAYIDDVIWVAPDQM